RRNGGAAYLNAGREEAPVPQVLCAAPPQAERALAPHQLGEERVVAAAVGEIVPVSAVRREERIDALPQVWMQRGRAQLLADARVHRARQVAPLEQIEQRALARADPEGRLDDRSDRRATSGGCDEHVHYEALAATLSTRSPLFTAAATVSIS